MNKKILLSLGAFLAVVAGVVGMAAYEAHIINVTAKIENALSVGLAEVDFGTVFPQEHLLFGEPVSIRLSDSFLEAAGCEYNIENENWNCINAQAPDDRVDDVNYVIKQKPKVRSPYNPYDRIYVSANGSVRMVSSDISNIDITCSETEYYGDNFYDVFIEDYTYSMTDDFDGLAWDFCENYSPDDWGNLDSDYYDYCYPLLGPYLSKHKVDRVRPTDQDGSAENSIAFDYPWDTDAYHNPYAVVLTGHLVVSADDKVDEWQLDLGVPCFEDQCAQEWECLGWEVPKELESQVFGTDLWIEVTGISENDNYAGPVSPVIQ